MVMGTVLWAGCGSWSSGNAEVTCVRSGMHKGRSGSVQLSSGGYNFPVVHRPSHPVIQQNQRNTTKTPPYPGLCQALW